MPTPKRKWEEVSCVARSGTRMKVTIKFRFFNSSHNLHSSITYESKLSNGCSLRTLKEKLLRFPSQLRYLAISVQGLVRVQQKLR